MTRLDKPIVKHGYGFEYASGVTTTTGDINPVTGKMNVAGSLTKFSSVLSAYAWVDRGDKRIVLSKAQIRRLYLGMTVKEFNEMLDMLEVV